MSSVLWAYFRVICCGQPALFVDVSFMIAFGGAGVLTRTLWPWVQCYQMRHIALVHPQDSMIIARASIKVSQYMRLGHMRHIVTYVHKTTFAHTYLDTTMSLIAAAIWAKRWGVMRKRCLNCSCDMSAIHKARDGQKNSVPSRYSLLVRV